MASTCKNCGQGFEITHDDLAFYDKVSPVIAGQKFSIPVPSHCPDCRRQQRLAFRNEWKLYHRKCDKTGKQIISIYSPGKPYTVYDQAVWWSDAYDPLAYGRDYDFGKPFFEQFAALNAAVPKSAIQNANSENCDYTNYSAENKNCYLVVGGLGAEDCFYCYRVFYSSDCVDCYDVFKCQHCYECLESSVLNNCVSCRNCHNSSDLFLCENCTGCSDCFGCANLRNQKFHIFNTAFLEADYRKKVAELRANLTDKVKSDIRALQAAVPHRYAQIVQCENSTGDQLLECKNCRDCYTLKHSQDCSDGIIGENNRDCGDCNFFDNCELQWNSTNNEKNYHVLSCMLVWYCKETFYCMNSFNSHDLFGCSGMKKHAYCVLNKQYTEEEYSRLVPKIIESMKAVGDFGNFFPIALSPFGYNETVAHDYFPLVKTEVLKRGWRWFDEENAQQHYLGPKIETPSTIEEVGDDVTQKILTCEVTGKPYKIIPQELAFYRTMKLPLPRRSPEQRHKDRLALRNPYRTWQQSCAKCAKKVETTYAPDRPEIVYCEECYLSTVY